MNINNCSDHAVISYSCTWLMIYVLMIYDIWGSVNIEGCRPWGSTTTPLYGIYVGCGYVVLTNAATDRSLACSLLWHFHDTTVGLRCLPTEARFPFKRNRLRWQAANRNASDCVWMETGTDAYSPAVADQVIGADFMGPRGSSPQYLGPGAHPIIGC